MSMRHACPLCDWSREAEHPTVLDPLCPECGGVLAQASAVAAPAPTLAALASRSRRADRLLLALVGGPILLAAAKLGWGAAGVAGAAGASAFAALALYVALAPDR